jgi:hypothetical protein
MEGRVEDGVEGLEGNRGRLCRVHRYYRKISLIMYIYTLEHLRRKCNIPPRGRDCRRPDCTFDMNRDICLKGRTVEGRLDGLPFP